MKSKYKELLEDERIIRAKKEILEVIKEKQSELIRIQPPQESYEKLIKETSEVRGGNLYYPYLGSGFGNGTLVELADGSVKYDLISGIGVHFWGHSNLGLIAENIDAALSDTVMEGHLQQNIDAKELMTLLTKSSGFDHCFLTTSGAMANENALKLLFQKQYPAERILAFENCFIGRTLSLAHITDKAAYREGLPKTVQVDYLPFNDTEKALKRLNELLDKNPQKYAAMCFELVQGEGGYNIGTKEFFRAIMEVLKKNNIKILVDEVQTFGRMPKLFAFQYFELEDLVDVVTIGKMSQICATLFNKELAPKPGLLSQTFTASVSAIRSAIHIIDSLINENFYGPNGKILIVHNHFAHHLNRLQEKYPNLIEGPWGIGGMIAFTPFKGKKEKVTAFAHKLFEMGVISFIAGSDPMKIRFLPPIKVITKKQIDEVMEIVERALIS